MNEHGILYLNSEDVRTLGGLDMKQALADVEETLRLFHEKDAIVPDKTAMGFGKSFFEEGVKGRINAMPGYLGGRYNMAGIKWIGSNPANIQKGLPRASALTILNDPDTKFPVCVLDGSDISAVRTGAAGGVAAKYLAKEQAETLLLIGGGLQNMTQLEAIYTVRPSLKNFYVCDINEEIGRNFAETMGRKLGIEIKHVLSPKECDHMPDISTNATSSPRPVVDVDMVGPGCLHISVGGLDHPDLYKKADKLVCDSWEQVRHRGSCYLAMAGLRGEVRDEDIYAQEIGEIISGKKPGRENDQEIIFFKPVGMGIEDIAVATRLYRAAIAQNVGTWLRYM